MRGCAAEWYITFGSADSPLIESEWLTHYIDPAPTTAPELQAFLERFIAAPMVHLGDDEVLEVTLSELEFVFDKLQQVQRLLDEGHLDEVSMVCARLEIMFADMIMSSD